MSTTTRRKRAHEEEDDHREQTTRFDFVYSDGENNENLEDLFERLRLLKQQLNDVKGRLSDKDIADWNR